jgi:hypothetical protein
LPWETGCRFRGAPNAVIAKFQLLASYAAASGHRVYNGEWGAQNGGDLTSRATWMCNSSVHDPIAVVAVGFPRIRVIVYTFRTREGESEVRVSIYAKPLHE